jgi:hypothetical protein
LFRNQDLWDRNPLDVIRFQLDGDGEDSTGGAGEDVGEDAADTGSLPTTAEFLLLLLHRGSHAPRPEERPVSVNSIETLSLTRLEFLEAVLDMWGRVFAQMSATLDGIDAAMGDDNAIQARLPAWRKLVCSWRYLMTKWGPCLKETSEFFGQAPEKATLKPKYDSLADGHERLARRVETTFQSLMSTMSIIESKNAIAQAESISKLTELAFIFIPLSFASSLFGMQIKVGPDLGIAGETN